MLVRTLSILALVSLVFCQFDSRWKERMRINPEAIKPKPLSIPQTLNHFDPLCNITFIQRSLYNDQFSKPGGPVIVYVGGEWEIADYGAMGGVAFQLAKKHHGFIFYPEHRYFGKSFPTNFQNPLSNEALRYFSPEQSIADLVTALHYVKERFENIKDSQTVLVGGSYAGALSVWARLKYPDSISMTYACGGATRNELEYKDYSDIIYKSYLKQGGFCGRFIKKGLAAAFQMMKTPETKKRLISLMGPRWNCYGQAHLLSDRDFKIKIYNTINSQLWYPNEWSDFCRYVKEHENNGSLVERFTDVITRTSSNIREIGHCMEKDDVQFQWNWLLCTGMAGFVTTDDSNFGDVYVLDDEIKVRCHDMFGFSKEYVEQRQVAGKILMGSNTPDTTRILMVQATQDPWSKATIEDDLNDQMPVIYIEGASHCPELGETQPNETASIIQAKIEVMDILAGWLDVA